MFSFGVMEIGVICLLAVLLFPPRELPKLARTVARFYGSIRRTAEDFKSAILEDPDLNEPIDEIKNAYRKTRWEVRRAEDAARKELAKARMDARNAVRETDPDDRAQPKIKGRVPVVDDDGLDEGGFDEDPAGNSDGTVGREGAGNPTLAVAKDPDDEVGDDDPPASEGAAVIATGRSADA